MPATPDVVYGSTVPRLYTPPLVTGPPGPCGCGCSLTPQTSKGFSAVDFARDVVGFEPLPWQRWVLIHGLELLPDGRYRFRIVLLLVARQSGKTTIVEIKNLFKMFVQGAEILGTAQDLSVSEESWDNAVEICEGLPELACEIKDVIKVNGKKALKLANGARWRVKAIKSTGRQAGRGPSADDVNFDELREHRTWGPWGAVSKTTLARPNAQRWCFSNAGDDTSVVLNAQRKKGRAAVEHPELDPTMGHFEYSAPDEVDCTCARVHPDPHKPGCRLIDPEVLRIANPALGYTIDLDALISDAHGDPNDVFRTECLCQSVDDLTPAIVDMVAWSDWADEDSLARGRVAFSLDMHPDLLYGAIGFTGRRSDGLLHWQILAHGEGTDWLLAEAVKLNQIHPNVGWFVDDASPAKAKKTDLEKAGLTVHVLDGSDTSQACINMLEAAKKGPGRFVPHQGQRKGKPVEVLSQAWRDAAKIPTKDSWRFGRKKSSGDITPLMVVTLSDHGFRVHGEKPALEPFALFG